MAFQQSYAPARSMPTPFQQVPAAQPRPLYFISRHTGMMVPLVPADELPFNVRLAGVPRVMRMEETYGMQHIGMAPYTGMTFQLERDIHIGTEAPEQEGVQRSTSQPPHAAIAGLGHARSQSGTPVKYLAPDAHARQALAQSAAYNNAAFAANGALPSRPVSAHETATSWRSTFNPSSTPSEPTIKTLTTGTSGTTDKTQSLIDAILATTSGAQEAARLGYTSRSAIPLPPAGALPDAEKKEYCTYWLRHGECDYMQQGCLYKHEMPDRETLTKIGFRQTPRWWVEKQLGVKVTGGGEKRETVGEVVKSDVWLKKGVKDGKESESESEAEQTPSESSKGSKESGEVKEKVVTEKSVAMPEPIKVVVLPKTDTKPKDASTTKASSTGTRAPPPPAIDIRKASTASSINLIDFAIPLLPTPSPSASTPSLTPASSVDSSPRQGQVTPLTPPTPATPEFVATPAKANKVFVPKGESPDYHVAEARKRQARQYARRGAPVSTIVGPVVPLERQIREMQKVKEGRKTHEEAGSKREGREREKSVGMMASKHAPGGSGSDGNAAARVDRKMAVKTGLRVRRPAVVAKPVQGPVKILKKEAAVEKK